MAYADYEFYRDVYGGKAVGGEDFPFLANKASAYIDAATTRRARNTSGETLDAVKMACCALADVFLDEENVNAASYSEEALLSGLSSEAVGSWSRTYKTRTSSASDAQIFDKRKRDALILYLGWTGLLKGRGYYAKGCGLC